MQQLRRVLFYLMVLGIVLMPAFSWAVLDYVEVIIPPGGLYAGETYKFRAVAYDENRNDISKKTKFTWRISDSLGSTITKDGWFRASTDSCTEYVMVYATCGSDSTYQYEELMIQPQSASKLIIDSDNYYMSLYNTVLAGAGATVYVNAWLQDRYGNYLGSDEAVLSLIDPKAGTLDENGDFTATDKPGIYRKAMHATCGKMKATADVVVMPKLPYYVSLFANGEEVEEDTLAVSPKSTTRLTARAYDENDNQIPNVEFLIYIYDYSTGKINRTGIFKAGELANYELELHVQPIWNGYYYGEDTDFSLFVVAGAPKKITLSSSRIVMVPQSSIELGAAAYDKFGNCVEEADIEYSVVNPLAGIIYDYIFESGTTPGIYKNAIKVVASTESASAEQYFDVEIIDGISQTDKDHAAYMLSALGKATSQTICADIGEITSKDEALSRLASTAEIWAASSDYFSGASEQTDGRSFFNIIRAVKYLAAMAKPLSNQSYSTSLDEWNWTGRKGKNALHYYYQAIKDGAGTIGLDINQIAGVAALTFDITREDGRELTASISVERCGNWKDTDTGKLNLAFKLDGKDIYDANLKMTRESNKVYEYGYYNWDIKHIVKGTLRLTAEDDYSIETTINMSYEDDLSYYSLALGSFTDSDGYTGKFIVEDDSWYGQIYNPQNIPFADIYDMDEYWQIYYLDGTDFGPIYYAAAWED